MTAPVEQKGREWCINESRVSYTLNSQLRYHGYTLSHFRKLRSLHATAGARPLCADIAICLSTASYVQPALPQRTHVICTATGFAHLACVYKQLSAMQRQPVFTSYLGYLGSLFSSTSSGAICRCCTEGSYPHRPGLQGAQIDHHNHACGGEAGHTHCQHVLTLRACTTHTHTHTHRQVSAICMRAPGPARICAKYVCVSVCACACVCSPSYGWPPHL